MWKGKSIIFLFRAFFLESFNLLANFILVLQASKLSAEDLMAGVDLVEVLLVDYSQRYASFGMR